MHHVDYGKASARVVRLGHREFQVLGLVVAGRENREIAVELRIGLTAVKTHVSALLQLARARNRAELIRWVHEHGADRPDGILTDRDRGAAVGGHPANCQCGFSYCPNPQTARDALKRDKPDAA